MWRLGAVLGRRVHASAAGFAWGPTHRRREAARRKVVVYATALLTPIVVMTIYEYWPERVDQPPPSELSQGPQPIAQRADSPAIRYPVSHLKSLPEWASLLPSSAVGEKALEEAVARFFGIRWLSDLLYRDDMVRRFVVTVDNLPGRQLPQQTLALRPPAGAFLASHVSAGMWMSDENAERYAPYLRAAESVDTQMLVAVYVHFFPLFQQAYQDLGYPSGYFNDRLIDAIDDLLDTPQIEGPIPLVQPKIMYEFADRDLESLSIGERIMLRLGPARCARIKEKLREIRRALTGGNSEPPR